MASGSPFPGMDPYLEQHWGDVHHRLVLYACDQLQPGLPSDLVARVEERVFVDTDDVADRNIYPDVRVIEHRGGKAAAAAARAGAAVAEPIVIHMPDEDATETFIEIIEIGTGRRVVTVIEVLSPANKLPGRGRRMYRQKQRELRRGRVNLVEINLLRDGRWTIAAPLYRIPPSFRTPYHVGVRRAATGAAEVYQAPLRERLPTIKVPLRKTDPDALLDLQALIEQAYHNGRYDTLDYRADPEPPLDPPDAEWAAALLKERGLR